jgi:hypothetical protein
MKLTKMSLVAALLIGSSAFAIENTTVSGNAQMFYQTNDSLTNGDLFDADDSGADIALHLNATSDLVKTDSVAISAGAGLTVLTSLGLENNLVGSVWGGAHTATGTKIDNVWWMNEAWMAATAGKTTVKVGRMALDTPLAFSEAWTVEQNTFEAAVVINEDIPDTTLIAGYIGNGNGTEQFGTPGTAGVGSVGAIVNANGEFTTYGSDGAYVIGAINNSFEPLTVQAWYYDVTRVVEAYWLQADLNIEGIMAGAQYSGHSVAAEADPSTPSSDVYALMLGYEMKDMFTAKASYSQVGKEYRAGFNTATDQTYAQTKLYTEAWWMYGRVTQADTASYNVTVEAPIADLFDFGGYYTNADVKGTDVGDVSDLTLVASKSFGPLDTSLVYSYIKDGNADAFNQIQAYLTLNF